MAPCRARSNAPNRRAGCVVLWNVRWTRQHDGKRETSQALRNAALWQGAGLAQHTAGFRFVKVLLRIISPKAKRLGVDGHVCEVILALHSMAPTNVSPCPARDVGTEAALGSGWIDLLFCTTSVGQCMFACKGRE